MIRRIAVAITLVGVVIASCGNDAPVVTTLPEGAEPVMLDLVQLAQFGANPPAIQITIQGTQPSPCHTVESQIARSGHTITVQLWAEHAAGVTCDLAPTGFQATVDLGTVDSGHWNVDLNGRRYELDV
ncbi:MAG: hypothetical protein A2Z12_09325 [Actinobacteria bacterium RBG_16_68_21]|nr:MAG: hypothetical protein A2Z12_09325 [Actinobacteria bacterium RBG_16_68_21]